MIKPQYLQSGDKVAIVAPSGRVNKTDVDFAKRKLKSWDLHVESGKHIFNDHFQYSGKDEERLRDLQEALNNAEVRAVFCARGGYGLIRIIDELDFTGFLKNPKWIIGFSDITIMHSHIHANFGVETLHATMTSGIKDNVSAETLRKSLFGDSLNYKLDLHPQSKKGNATGIVTGGNLAILCSLIGSESDIDTSDKILFIEDLGEYLYRIDRMMWGLKRAGKLENLAGLIVGGMTNMKDNESPFGKKALEIVMEAVKNYNFPVCAGFPAGHQSDNRPLILGRKIKMSVDREVVINF